MLAEGTLRAKALRWERAWWLAQKSKRQVQLGLRWPDAEREAGAMLG